MICFVHAEINDSSDRRSNCFAPAALLASSYLCIVRVFYVMRWTITFASFAHRVNIFKSVGRKYVLVKYPLGTCIRNDQRRKTQLAFFYTNIVNKIVYLTWCVVSIKRVRGKLATSLWPWINVTNCVRRATHDQ